MSDIDHKNSLLLEVRKFLASVSEDNFSESYDGLALVITKYRGTLTKTDVFNILSVINNEQLTDWQEEVLIEISNRLYGHCRPQLEIKWS